jgi:outer membrane lipoprotein SlyB
MMPQYYQNYKEVEGLCIAINPVDSEEKSEEIFGTDMKTANILPIQLIVHNTGRKEFEINHQQIFGVTANDEYTVAYTLNKAATHVRNSSIGTTAVTGAVVGAVAGAAIGAGIGAGIGQAAGDAGKGAEAGAIIGGVEGASVGTAVGLSDSFTVKFKRELANLAFEDRVIFPGDVQQGFIYVKWKPYTSIRVKIFNITDNKISDLQFNINVKR